MMHAFSFCLFSVFWHHGILNISKRFMVLFWFFFGFWLSVRGAWFLVLEHLSALFFFFFFFFFFAGDKYLRHSALDSNCIYSFGFYFLPALQSKSFFTQELLEKYIQVYMCPAYE